VKSELGDTYHGDHGYAQYFTPQNARDTAIILWHGVGQSGRSWESTPDGREGFWQILTRQDWPIYIIDQPRRGRAGRFIFDPAEHEEGAHPTLDSEASAWNVFRLGPWDPPNAPEFFPGLQFPTDEPSIHQFLRQQIPNTGPEPFPDAEHREFMGDAVAQLVDVTGPSVLMCHSHSAQYAWVTAMNRPDQVKAIVAIEPGEFAFPDVDPPPDIPTHDELLASFMAPQLVPAERFDVLTRQPILVILGDNITVEPHTNYGVELWRIVRERAQQFVATVNRRGGDATYLELPDAGLKGNTHFAMSDLNNVEVAQIVTDFLGSKGLDGRDAPHRGPRR
jgi:pimeloyl-ACP methyl ester carboxylesterase